MDGQAISLNEEDEIKTYHLAGFIKLNNDAEFYIPVSQITLIKETVNIAGIRVAYIVCPDETYIVKQTPNEIFAQLAKLPRN